MYENNREKQKYFHREEDPKINHTEKGMVSFSHHPGNCHGSQFGRIGAEDDIKEYRGLTNEQIERILEDRELKAGTQILELVQDIPDADMKPPENVLFICKLNPDTQEKDLKIIFSRFGKILSCDIITDSKTGDSLQYGFIEFEKIEYCENAYFKMDNVLIDDRRIHVDFCQSIHQSKWNNSKLKHKYKLDENYISDNQYSDSELRTKDHSNKRKRSPDSSPHHSHKRHDTPSVRR
ncbi:hypothetical protein MXB_1012, partial [Myxobolus squamalis]